MVRLKVAIHCRFFRHIIHFNSTMVRLKGHYTIFQIQGLTIFQFHYGTIKRAASTDIHAELSLISIPLWYD